MSDRIEPAEALQPEELLELQNPTGKPRRGRKRSMDAQDVTATLGESTRTESKPRATRTKKLTGAQVASMIEKGSLVAVAMTRHEHWYVPADEVKPWTDSAAELLNSIPAKYVQSAMNLSAYFAVGIGVYQTFGTRLAIEQAIRAKERAERAGIRQDIPRHAQNGVVEDVPSDPLGAYA